MCRGLFNLTSVTQVSRASSFRDMIVRRLRLVRGSLSLQLHSSGCRYLRVVSTTCLGGPSHATLSTRLGLYRVLATRSLVLSLSTHGTTRRFEPFSPVITDRLDTCGPGRALQRWSRCRGRLPLAALQVMTRCPSQLASAVQAFKLSPVLDLAELPGS